MKKLIVFLMVGSVLCSQTAVLAQLNYEGVLLISEVAYDAPGDDSQEEWFEIINVGSVALSLNGIRVGDEETSGGKEGMLRFPEGANIQAGQVIVIAQTAVGFRRLFGFNPNFEIVESDTAVPNMRRSLLWASGDVALANDGDELILLQENRIIDALNYEEKETFFAPSINAAFRGQSIMRNPANCDSDTAADWQTAVQPTPGIAPLNDSCREVVNPALLESLISIGDIQGEGHNSPFVNQEVTFRGIMTGHHADTNASGITFYTIFVQDLAGYEDGNLQTSDGIVVFLGRERPFVEVGDQVRITGQVTEFFGLTEIDDDNLKLHIENSGNDLPSPVELDGMAPSQFETIEGMRVSVANGWVVGPSFQSCGLFINLSGSERFFQRDGEGEAGERPFSLLNHQEASCEPIPPLKFGDQLQNSVGPLTYHFDEYKLVIQPDANLQVEAMELPTSPLLREGEPQEISIVTFNFQNHFDDIDDTGTAAEPKFTQAEIQNKEAKLAYAIGQLLNCPTIIGVQEVEKESLLLSLASQLEPVCGFEYEVTHLESADVRGIDVALLSQPDVVQVVEATLLQTCSSVETAVIDETMACALGQNPLFSRPPLRVVTEIQDQSFTFIVNHFKSKRGGEAETAVRRHAQARFVNQWATDQLATDLQANIVVMGDFNDFEASETMQLLTANGRLSNVLLSIPDESRYSFSFGGVSQLIDGILLSPNLVETAIGVDILHVNADYPFQFAPNLEEAIHLRSSDHDLPIIWLSLKDETPEPIIQSIITTEVAPIVSEVEPNELPATPEPIQNKVRVMGGIVVLIFVLVGFILNRKFLRHFRNYK